MSTGRMERPTPALKRGSAQTLWRHCIPFSYWRPGRDICSQATEAHTDKWDERWCKKSTGNIVPEIYRCIVRWKATSDSHQEINKAANHGSDQTTTFFQLLSIEVWSSCNRHESAEASLRPVIEKLTSKYCPPGSELIVVNILCSIDRPRSEKCHQLIKIKDCLVSNTKGLSLVQLHLVQEASMTLFETRRNEAWPIQSAPVKYDRFQNGSSPGASDVFIAVMGMTGTGKSTFISHCTNEEVRVSESGSLESCTAKVRVYPCDYFRPQANVYLVDTPGFDDTNKTDADILKEIANWLTYSYKRNVRLKGILYLHRISDNRLGGCAKKNLIMFRKLCGPGSEESKSVTLVTTFWENVNPIDGETRVRNLTSQDNYWGYLVKRGAQVRRHYHNRESALKIIEPYISSLAEGSTEEVRLAIQTEMVDSGKSLHETAAGQTVQYEIEEVKKVMQKEIRELNEAMQEAIQQRDKQYYNDLWRERAKQIEQLQQRDEHLRTLKITMEQMHKESYRLSAELQKETRLALEENRRVLEDRETKHAKEIRQIHDHVESRFDDLKYQLSEISSIDPRLSNNSIASTGSVSEVSDTAKASDTKATSDEPAKAEYAHYKAPYVQDESDGFFSLEPENDEKSGETKVYGPPKSDQRLPGELNRNDKKGQAPFMEHHRDHDPSVGDKGNTERRYTLYSSSPPSSSNFVPNLKCCVCFLVCEDDDELFQHLEDYQHACLPKNANASDMERVPYKRSAKWKRQHWIRICDESKNSHAYFTCRYCKVIFESDDALYRHLEQSRHAMNSVTGKVERYQRPQWRIDIQQYLISTPEKDLSELFASLLLCRRCGFKFPCKEDLLQHLEDYQHAVDLKTGMPRPFTRSSYDADRYDEYIRDLINQTLSVKRDCNSDCLTCHCSYPDKIKLLNHLKHTGHARNVITLKPENLERSLGRGIGNHQYQKFWDAYHNAPNESSGGRKVRWSSEVN